MSCEKDLASYVDSLSEFADIATGVSSDRRRRIFLKIVERVVVELAGYQTPCWMWQGPTSGTGRGGDYPRMTLDGATVAVHIALWVNAHGLIPPRKQLDHLCRNRNCVRPSHCELVTHKENQRRRDEANGIVRRPKRRGKKS